MGNNLGNSLEGLRATGAEHCQFIIKENDLRGSEEGLVVNSDNLDFVIIGNDLRNTKGLNIMNTIFTAPPSSPEEIPQIPSGVIVNLDNSTNNWNLLPPFS
jgi:hypothetical protein